MKTTRLALPQLKLMCAELKNEMNVLNKKMIEVGTQRKAKQQSLNEIEDHIRALQASKPNVTDHAVIRYFQRVLGYDIKLIKEGLIKDHINVIKEFGDCNITHEGGYELIVKNHSVVTIKT